MSRWFRMYDELLDDPKAQRLEPALFKTWINLLCLASRRGGTLPPGASDIAFALRLSMESVEQAVKQLTECGLIDETANGLIPHNWDGRQYKSDVSTERVKRFRNGDETPAKREMKRSRSVSVSESASASESGKEDDEFFFEAWYATYPRRQGRGQALKAFRAALRKTDFDTLMAGVARYKTGLKPDYADWAMPATWLNGERWLDEASASGVVPQQPKNGPKAFVPSDAEAAWPLRMKGFKENGFWSSKWGPKPGEPGCEVPAKHLGRPPAPVGDDLDIPAMFVGAPERQAKTRTGEAA